MLKRNCIYIALLKYQPLFKKDTRQYSFILQVASENQDATGYKDMPI